MFRSYIGGGTDEVCGAEPRNHLIGKEKYNLVQLSVHSECNLMSAEREQFVSVAERMSTTLHVEVDNRDINKREGDRMEMYQI